ncbi:MAG: PP2C family protein-serine/threonine phosphatase, partial [Opitutales bacterium]
KCELVELPGGTVMGIPGSNASKPKAIEMQVGDRFYAFTDGIVEASDPDGEEFGMKRIIQCFEELSDKSVDEVQKKIYKIIAKHTESESQQDDITMLGFELS